MSIGQPGRETRLFLLAEASRGVANLRRQARPGEASGHRPGERLAFLLPPKSSRGRTDKACSAVTTRRASTVIASAAKQSRVPPPLARRIRRGVRRNSWSRKERTTQSALRKRQRQFLWRDGLLRCARNYGERGMNSSRLGAQFSPMGSTASAINWPIRRSTPRRRRPAPSRSTNFLPKLRSRSMFVPAPAEIAELIVGLLNLGVSAAVIETRECLTAKTELPGNGAATA